jgi:ubiquinone/menaquinone biosynthesis C-methylase UbiE
MECYKDFAHIYDELISGDVNYKLWSEKIISICEKYNVAKRDYLDLACGTGNLTIEIGKSFISTTAVDLSQEMLTRAEEKLREHRLRFKMFCQNISMLNLRKSFDLITCGLDSTNYILNDEELTSYFKGVYNHLKDDGIFIFDINSEYKLKNILGNNSFNYDSDEVVYLWENEIEDDIVNMFLTFFVKEGQVYRRFNEEHRERIYSEKFLDELLAKVGFIIYEKLDNYESNSLNEETERIVYILGKKS